MSARFRDTAASAMRATQIVVASFVPASFALAAESSAGVVTAGSMLQVMMGLGVVLLFVAAIAWTLKRFALRAPGGNGNLRVVAGAAVGQRERVVIVEIGATWLVVGVAPGQVRALHTLSKPESSVAPIQSHDDNGFAVWLKKMMERRHAG